MTVPEFCPPPPPQPGAPSAATPASPAPPSFKKSRRLSRFLLDVALRSTTVCSLDIFLLFPTAASYHRRQHTRMLANPCATSLPRYCGVSLTRSEESSVGKSNPLDCAGYGGDGTAVLLEDYDPARVGQAVN